MTAIDEEHKYPEEWGIVGDALDIVDAPVLRFFLGMLIDQFADEHP